MEFVSKCVLPCIIRGTTLHIQYKRGSHLIYRTSEINHFSYIRTGSSFCGLSGSTDKITDAPLVGNAVFLHVQHYWFGQSAKINLISRAHLDSMTLICPFFPFSCLMTVIDSIV